MEPVRMAYAAIADRYIELFGNSDYMRACGRYEVGSMHQISVRDHALAGILAWYSLIHLSPDGLDSVLAELRRTMAPGGTLVFGFFDGDELMVFEHKIVTAYRWPADKFSARLKRAGFTEIERQLRPGLPETGLRSHAAIVAIAK
jgi:hypothetical protein